MRATTDLYRASLTASHRVVCQIDAWYNGALTYAALPVTAATVTFDDTAQERRKLRFTVPDTLPDGTVLDPRDSATAPLAAYGQRVQVRAGIVCGDGSTELLNLGWYLITEWERSASDRTVTVSATDLSKLLRDDRFYHSEVPSSGQSYSRELDYLADGILPVYVSPELYDGLTDGTVVYGRDRWKDILDLAYSWPARVYVDDDARLSAMPTYLPVDENSTPVLTLQSGSAGTVVDRDRSGMRDLLYNAVVVTGKSSTDDTTVAAPFGYAEITDPASPIRVGGPFGKRPWFLASDMLTSDDICQFAAQNWLQEKSALSRSETIVAIPDASLELGDIVRVVTDGYAWIGRVRAIELPLLATGAMSVTVSNAPSDEGT